jgi:hypothetical protein
MSNLSFELCCAAMAEHITDNTIKYYPKFREYGIPIIDGGTSFIEILYCPWCGQQLPCSLRGRWFDLLDEMGIECDEINRIPEDMNTDAWWAKRQER